MKRIVLPTACCAIAITAGLTACSSADQPAPSSRKTAAPQQVQIPDAVKVRSDDKLAGSFEGHGVQIYQCTSNSWTLSQPKARNGFRRSTVAKSARHRYPTLW